MENYPKIWQDLISFSEKSKTLSYQVFKNNITVFNQLYTLVVYKTGKNKFYKCNNPYILKRKAHVSRIQEESCQDFHILFRLILS